MNSTRFPFHLLLATLAATLWMPASAQKIAKPKITQNIPYTVGSQGAVLGDLYQPTGSGPFPAIVFLHGGSWRSGNKSSFLRLATDLAAKGYAGFSIDYDLHPHSFPLSWEEAEAAIRFLRKHAAEYRLDPSQIVIAGTSAGGELAALVALAPNGPAAPAKSFNIPTDDTPDTVSAALILNGVFDLSSSAHVITRYLGADCRQVEAACNDASPIRHIHSRTDARADNVTPPFFVGHGTADHTVPYAEAQAFITALREAHISVTAYTATGGPHMYWEKKTFYAPNLAAIEGFLATVLHPAPAPR